MILWKGDSLVELKTSAIFLNEVNVHGITSRIEDFLTFIYEARNIWIRKLLSKYGKDDSSKLEAMTELKELKWKSLRAWSLTQISNSNNEEKVRSVVDPDVMYSYFGIVDALCPIMFEDREGCDHLVAAIQDDRAWYTLLLACGKSILTIQHLESTEFTTTRPPTSTTTFCLPQELIAIGKRNVTAPAFRNMTQTRSDKSILIREFLVPDMTIFKVTLMVMSLVHIQRTNMEEESECVVPKKVKLDPSSICISSPGGAQRVAFIVSLVCSSWDELAIQMGFDSVEEFVLPYIKLSIENCRYLPLKNRSDGFSSIASRYSFDPRRDNDSGTPEVDKFQNFLEIQDIQLRELTSCFLDDVFEAVLLAHRVHKKEDLMTVLKGWCGDGDGNLSDRMLKMKTKATSFFSTRKRTVSKSGDMRSNKKKTKRSAGDDRSSHSTSKPSKANAPRQTGPSVSSGSIGRVTRSAKTAANVENQVSNVSSKSGIQTSLKKLPGSAKTRQVMVAKSLETSHKTNKSPAGSTKPPSSRLTEGNNQLTQTVQQQKD